MDTSNVWTVPSDNVICMRTDGRMARATVLLLRVTSTRHLKSSTRGNLGAAVARAVSSAACLQHYNINVSVYYLLEIAATTSETIGLGSPR